MESRKLSCWRDNNISAKNSKWLANNLKEMNQNIECMMKLIQEDGDSFARRAEMYYKKRPELILHVWDFQYMYQSLAERYAHLNEELKRNLTPVLMHPSRVLVVPPELGSEASSSCLSPEPKFNRFKCTHRAAGFEFFMGPGACTSDRIAKGDETSWVSDSEAESDISSVHNYPRFPGNNSEEALHEKEMQLEAAELSDDKEKENFAMMHQEEDNSNGSFKNVLGSRCHLDLQSKIANYEGEIANLKMELEKARLHNTTNFSVEPFPQAAELLESSSDTEEMEFISDADQRIHTLIEEMRVHKGRVCDLEKQVANLTTEKEFCLENIHRLEEQLQVAQKDAAMWKAKLETEMRKASKCQDRIARYKASLTDRDDEIRELKEVISDANKKYQLHAEISRLADEKNRLEESLREWEVRCHLLQSQHSLVEKKLNDEIGHLKKDISQKKDQLEALKKDLDTFSSKYDALLGERDELSAKVAKLMPVAISSSLICNIHEFEVLKSKVELLGKEVERQKVLILEGAEEKREAIRQLCISLEHYRNGYEQIRRQAVTGNKRRLVCAS